MKWTFVSIVRWIGQKTPILLMAVLLAGCGQAALPQPIPQSTLDSYPGNVDPPLVVDVGWLLKAKAENADSMVILDASDVATYSSGHIPGSIHAWWQDTMDPNAPAYGMMLGPDENAFDPQRLRKNLIEDLGVSPESTIIAYDNSQNLHASMLVWTLRFLGYNRTAVLDGGLGAWIGAGQSVEKRGAKADSTVDPVIDPQQNWYLVKDQVLTRLADPAFVIVDIRSESERNDDIDSTIEPGTIPGSLWLPWNALIDPGTGKLLSSSELGVLFATVGIAPDKTVILYGRFGLEATFAGIVLKIMGFHSVLLYNGGWAEWAADPATPKTPPVTS